MPALAYSVEYAGDWQITTFGDGVMGYVGPDKGQAPVRVTSVNLSKKITVHGEERYLPAFVMVDLGVARPTYLTPYFSVTGFRLFCPMVRVGDASTFVGSAHRSRFEFLRVTEDGDIAFAYEFIYRTWPIETERDLFRIAGEMTLSASQDGIVADSTCRLENISGEPVQIDKWADEANPMFKAGSLFRMLMLQSGYCCEPVSDGDFDEYLKESHEGRGNNGDYLFHTDDLMAKEKVLMPPYASRSVFFTDADGETEYRLSNDRSRLLTYGVDWMVGADTIRGAHGTSDVTEIRSHNDLMPHASWSVRLVSTSGSLGDGLKGTMTQAIENEHGPDGDTITAGYSPDADYLVQNDGAIPADFRQNLRFVVSNPPQGTLIRRPAAPSIVEVSRERLVVETGIDLPDGYGSLPVSVQLYLSEQPLVDDTMPPVALERDFDLSKSKEEVEVDIGDLTAESEELRYGRILVHFKRNYAIDQTSYQIAVADFEL